MGQSLQQPVMKTFAIFDLDLTITDCDTFVAFLLHVLATSPRRCLRALWLPWALVLYYCGLRDNTWLKQAFLRTIAGGATRFEVEAWAKHYVGRLSQKGIRPKALHAIAEHRAQGHHLLLASASFDFYVIPLATMLGFDSVIATKAEWHNDTLSGTILGQNCYGQHKFERVVAFLAEGKNPSYTIAYSDHYTDLPLLLWVNEAYTVNPKQKMKKFAVEHAIPVLDW